MTAALTMILTLGLLGQVPPTGDGKDEREARLEYMKTSLASYDVRSTEGEKVSYRLQSEPILRFTNPVGVTVDGAIFLWLGEDGRPEAAVQAFLMRNGLWGHDFTSLSKAPLVARTSSGPSWSPRQGIEFKPVPGAPRPADSADQRLRQMKELVEGFAVSDDFRSNGWQALRPMPKPFARYGKPGTSTVDGGLFCFALGTDPEAFLMLEAHAGKDGTEWQYAFAPQTMYALKASWKGTEAWTSPLRGSAGPNETFYNTVLRSNPVSVPRSDRP
jgi:hypothetical protein